MFTFRFSSCNLKIRMELSYILLILMLHECHRKWHQVVHTGIYFKSDCSLKFRWHASPVFLRILNILQRSVLRLLLWHVEKVYFRVHSLEAIIKGTKYKVQKVKAVPVKSLWCCPHLIHHCRVNYNENQWCLLNTIEPDLIMGSVVLYCHCCPSKDKTPSLIWSKLHWSCDSPLTLPFFSVYVFFFHLEA